MAGQTLYRVDKNDTVKQIGAITGTDIVYFADNSIHVMIVGLDTYKYTITSESLSIINANDGSEFMGASDVTLLDSRLVWTVPNSGRIQWSDLTVVTENGIEYFKAPMVLKSMPGTKRIGYFHEDSSWMTVHPTNQTDVDEIEKEVIVPEDEVDSFLKSIGYESKEFKLCHG